MRRPASQFYWSDWLRDPSLRASSLEARGLWIDMLALMHEGEPYGHLTVGGSIVDDAKLARMVGESKARVSKFRIELEAHGVFSRTSAGVIFSRRMVRDEYIRDVRAESGKLGGNPNLKQKGGKKDKQKPTPSSASSSSSSGGRERESQDSLSSPPGEPSKLREPKGPCPACGLDVGHTEPCPIGRAAARSLLAVAHA